MAKIGKLTGKNIEQATAIADTVFAGIEELPGVGFRASLCRKALLHYNEHVNPGVVSLEYFVAMEEESRDVAGVIGLYSMKEDQEEALWVGWFCVDPKHRGKGIGTLLLDYIISETKSRGKKYLRLYTSTHSNEAAAQVLYENKGFRIVPERGREKRENYEIFYRELNLDMIT